MHLCLSIWGLNHQLRHKPLKYNTSDKQTEPSQVLNLTTKKRERIANKARIEELRRSHAHDTADLWPLKNLSVSDIVRTRIRMHQHISAECKTQSAVSLEFKKTSLNASDFASTTLPKVCILYVLYCFLRLWSRQRGSQKMELGKIEETLSQMQWSPWNSDLALAVSRLYEQVCHLG